MCYKKSVLFFLLHFIFTMLLSAQILQNEVEYEINSGVFDGMNLEKPINLFSTIISHKDAIWLRVNFSSVKLGRNSYVLIKSLKDGLWQKLNSTTIEQWNFSSAYFNGNSIEISLAGCHGRTVT